MRVLRIIGHQLIPLPHGIDTHDLLALATEMLTAAAAKKRLPAAIARARAKLIEARDRLRQAASDQLDAAPAAGGPRRVGGEGAVSSASLDGKWAALNHYLLACSRMGETDPETETAKALLALLFAGGLDFTKLPYKQKWSQSESRLQRMGEDAVAAQLLAVGASRFVAAVGEAHNAYGAAIGVTAPLPPEPQPKEGVKQHLDALADAVRSYAFKVAAHAEEDRAETVSLSDALLAPLTTWESRKPAPAPQDTPSPAAQPEPSAPHPQPQPGPSTHAGAPAQPTHSVEPAQPAAAEATKAA